MTAFCAWHINTFIVCIVRGWAWAWNTLFMSVLMYIYYFILHITVKMVDYMVWYGGERSLHVLFYSFQCNAYALFLFPEETYVDTLTYPICESVSSLESVETSSQYMSCHFMA